MIRNRERMILEEVVEKLQVASDLVATILEGRADDEDDGVNFGLRMIYAGLAGLIDDVEEVSDEP
jgi:hypothetical protein